MDIRTLRKRAGMTQQELSAACGVCQSTIGNYEAGIRTPNMKIAKEIVRAVRAKGVKVSIDDIFDNTTTAA